MDKQKIEALAKLIHDQTAERIKKQYHGLDPEIEAKVIIKHGLKYTKVDVNTSGRYMIDQGGNIYGIKAYGVIHRGHLYGTIDTINDYYWGDYTAIKIKKGEVRCEN